MRNRAGWKNTMHKHTRFMPLSMLLVCALPFLFVLTASAQRSAVGRISGQLLDGTKQGTPVGGQRVTLQITRSSNVRDFGSVITNAQGAFSFDGLDTDQAMRYAVYTRYQGVRYITDGIDLSKGTAQQITLTVYEATTSSPGLIITQAVVLLSMPGAPGGIIGVSEYLFLKNPGARTYVGSLGASGGEPNALRFSLPPGARHLSPGMGFADSHVAQGDQGFATDAALLPGISRFAFSFEIPYRTADAVVDYAVVYPTMQLSVLVPAQVRASSSALSSLGIITINQGAYALFQARDLRAGVVISTQLENLPVLNPAPNASTLNQGVLWLAVGLLILLALLLVTRSLYRPSPALPRRWKRGQIGRDMVVKHAASQDQQQALLQALLDLDTAYAAGHLQKAEYRRRRAATKARLRVLMSAEIAEKTSGTGTA